MQSKSEFVLRNGFSIRDLNPENYALKNDYIDNLFTTAYQVIDKIAIPSGLNISIVRGFLSRNYIENELSKEAEGHTLIYRFSKGLALSITWDDFNYASALTVARHFVDSVSNSTCIVTDKCLEVYRKTKKQEILHKTSSETRRVG